MKLYIYEHCPFSARVRYVAGMLNIPLDVIILDYDDDKTTNEIIGSKQVPLLIKESGEAMAESLDIIQFLLESVNSSETAQPAQTTLDWQRSAFLPLQKSAIHAGLSWTCQSLKPHRLNAPGKRKKRQPNSTLKLY